MLGLMKVDRLGLIQADMVNQELALMYAVVAPKLRQQACNEH